MPQNWRLKIAEKHASISVRTMTEVFNLRNKKAENVSAVWGTINEALNEARQFSLAEKVKNYISSCSALDNVIQNNNQ